VPVFTFLPSTLLLSCLSVCSMYLQYILAAEILFVCVRISRSLTRFCKIFIEISWILFLLIYFLLLPNFFRNSAQ
jgi:hypothetical protein